MTVTPTYPGVYIEEVPSGVRTIMGVATSITAFVGRARRGRTNYPIRIHSFADFERVFGRLWVESTMSYAVQHFFLHGGRDALIIRAFRPEAGATEEDSTATMDLATPNGALQLRAASPGEWGDFLRAYVDYRTKDPGDNTLFNLTIAEVDDQGLEVARETHLNLSTDANSPRFATMVLEQESYLVRVHGDVPGRPAVVTDPNPAVAVGGDDGDVLQDADILGVQNDRTGMYALEEADLFNLLCLPPLTRDQDVDPTATLAHAATYCKDRRAVLIVDPPSGWRNTAQAENGINSMRSDIGNDAATNAAVFFPRLRMADPLKENRTEEFVPCGAVAGVIARTDAQRGTWKAPAGIEASLLGVREQSYKLTDNQHGVLNPLGLNCLRNFRVYGNVIWGARTLAGADQLASEWKYLPVRRIALYIEESLFRGTQWMVFEPNDQSLWAQARLNVGAFMQNLFRQGAFQGTSPREAYFVKCDEETTTQNDIDRGIVNIIVGFAPLKPAEFVIIKIQQIAGKIAT